MNQQPEELDIKSAVMARQIEENGQIDDAEKDGVPDSEFILQCLRENEFGDGNLFKRLYRSHFVFNKSADCWMRWDGHHWIMDIMGDALASVEGVAQVYQGEANQISREMSKLEAAEDSSGRAGQLKSTRAKLNQRVKLLRSDTRRVKCLRFAHTSSDALAIKGDEIDAKPWLLACKNGVIDLRTGELEPGRQKDYLLKASPVEWNGIDAPCPLWEKSLLEIFSEKQPIVDCFQRVCGYAAVGKVVQSILVVMTGRGRNGKSIIVETLSKAFGHLAGAIRSEMLLDQFKQNSSGPTPEIMTLRGLRMAFASETDDGCRISPSRSKWITGNDTLTGRSPHDKHEVQFLPSHTLFLLTNHKPHAPADDYAFWARMVLFPFELSFVGPTVDEDEAWTPKNSYERRADPYLSAKLEAELPGILAWIVRGCLSWQVMGVAPPTAVLDAVDEYQRDEDTIADFIDECCVVGENYSVGATAIYKVFEEWWKTNVSNKIPKQKSFSGWLGKRFEKRKEGSMKYYGVGILDNTQMFP